MKQAPFIIFLTGLCLVASCGRKSDAQKMADMKNCKKIEIGSYVITDPEKIERIISALQRRRLNHENYESQFLLTASMEAIDRWGKTVSVKYAKTNTEIIFQDGVSEELYALFKEYNLFMPTLPAGRPGPYSDPNYLAEHIRVLKNSDTPVAKIARVEDCQKLEFAFQGNYADAVVIDDPNKIKKIIAAIQQRKYSDTEAHIALFSFSIRATDSKRKAVVADYTFGRFTEYGFVVFRDGESVELYALLEGYGVIKPGQSVVPWPYRYQPPPSGWQSDPNKKS